MNEEKREQFFDYVNVAADFLNAAGKIEEQWAFVGFAHGLVDGWDAEAAADPEYGVYYKKGYMRSNVVDEVDDDDDTEEE